MCASLSRRYGAKANNVKVHTSEQVKELITALADETDANGKRVTPFTYAETYNEMYAELMARDKPILRFSRQTDLLTSVSLADSGHWRRFWSRSALPRFPKK